jgi:hypothetical protein
MQIRSTRGDINARDEIDEWELIDADGN